MIEQPKQFGFEYASIFQDRSVVDAYANRSPYPPETFEILADLIDRSVAPRRILDAGCGLGQMTSGLLPHAEQIDAVDFSANMIEAAKRMPYGADPRINWVVGGIEEVELTGPYGLIVAAASLHWMPWSQTLPRFARLISQKGYLAMVEGSSAPAPWAAELSPLFARYSMNQDFQPYNMLTVADELEQHGLFQRVDVMETQPVPVQQPIDDRIEAIHSQNGFSRDRMDPGEADEFDEQVRYILEKHCPSGTIDQLFRARIVYGKV